ncbi:MAG: hypothetical protein HQL12_08045 [Candidatus Omnitrophica bacterium]|nr:hypothetical protein [Candidatus Omnitrophota bacterium]
MPPLIRIMTVLAFLVNVFGPLPTAHADEFRLPAPGAMVHLSLPLEPPILKGIKVHTDNPLRFDFIIDKGDSFSKENYPSLAGGGNLKEEATKLIKYFLASLTIPEKDLWVNLSPYEKDRIIPNSFGFTEMGRDLLAEDYMLKQITASLIYPEDKTGKKFWKRIYEQAAKRFKTTDIPVNTFNKVWIIPEKAVVYENAKAGTAYVVESKLKVMLEQDYLSIQKHDVETPFMASHKDPRGNPLRPSKDINALGSQIVREVVIPELTKEVNENKSFFRLRQIYNSLILATWYKKKIKESILAQVYTDKSKVAGVNIDDPKEVGRIYQKYLRAFKKGVFNYIKEEQDPLTQEVIPRKYFSGGVNYINLRTKIQSIEEIPAVATENNNLAMITAEAASVPNSAFAFFSEELLPENWPIRRDVNLRSIYEANDIKDLLDRRNSGEYFTLAAIRRILKSRLKGVSGINSLVDKNIGKFFVSDHMLQIWRLVAGYTSYIEDKESKGFHPVYIARDGGTIFTIRDAVERLRSDGQKGANGTVFHMSVNSLPAALDGIFKILAEGQLDWEAEFVREYKNNPSNKPDRSTYLDQRGKEKQAQIKKDLLRRAVDFIKSMRDNGQFMEAINKIYGELDNLGILKNEKILWIDTGFKGSIPFLLEAIVSFKDPSRQQDSYLIHAENNVHSTFDLKASYMDSDTKERDILKTIISGFSGKYYWYKGDPRDQTSWIEDIPHVIKFEELQGALEAVSQDDQIQSMIFTYYFLYNSALAKVRKEYYMGFSQRAGNKTDLAQISADETGLADKQDQGSHQSRALPKLLPIPRMKLNDKVSHILEALAGPERLNLALSNKGYISKSFYRESFLLKLILIAEGAGPSDLDLTIPQAVVSLFFMSVGGVSLYSSATNGSTELYKFFLPGGMFLAGLMVSMYALKIAKSPKYILQELVTRLRFGHSFSSDGYVTIGTFREALAELNVISHELVHIISRLTRKYSFPSFYASAVGIFAVVDEVLLESSINDDEKGMRRAMTLQPRLPDFRNWITEEFFSTAGRLVKDFDDGIPANEREAIINDEHKTFSGKPLPAYMEEALEDYGKGAKIAGLAYGWYKVALEQGFSKEDALKLSWSYLRGTAKNESEEKLQEEMESILYRGKDHAMLNPKDRKDADVMSREMFEEVKKDPKDFSAIEKKYNLKYLGSGGNGYAFIWSIDGREIVIKFLVSESQAGREAEGLKRGIGKPLFQQYIAHRDGQDKQLGWIVSDYVKGNHFEGPTYSEWQKLSVDEQKKHLSDVTKRINEIPDKHWDQLIQIFTIAHDKDVGIIIDPKPGNFLYDRDNGFRVIDYHAGSPRYSLYDELVTYNYLAVIVGGTNAYQRGKENDERVREIVENRLLATGIAENPNSINSQGDKAMKIDLKKGGIDLTPANMSLQTKNNGGEIKFHLDPAMLQQLQNALGFMPVIINIRPMDNLREFLGAPIQPSLLQREEI